MSIKRTAALLDRAAEDNLVIRHALDPDARLTDLAGGVDVPPALVPAIMSGRHELVALAQPTDLKAREVAVLYDMIGCLLQSNTALRTHAERLAIMTAELSGHLRGFQSSAEKVREFAEFRLSEPEARERDRCVA